MSRPVRPAPREFSKNWPKDRCSDPVTEVARLLAVKLGTVTDKHGVREVARRAGVSGSIISRAVNGKAWMDTATLARLEIELGVDLWPKRTRAARRSKT
jgi:transcriptional regulator with XRE-family HTH domain